MRAIEIRSGPDPAMTGTSLAHMPLRNQPMNIARSSAAALYACRARPICLPLALLFESDQASGASDVLGALIGDKRPC